MDYNKLYETKNDIYYSHNRNEIVAYIPQNIKTVLDVGCGIGLFGELLKTRLNCTVWGVEPDSASAAEAGKRLDKVVNNLFANNLPELAGQKFDAIFFNDVLEHLVDPDEILASCKTLLNDNGYIIASIPNMRWYPVILSLLRYKDFKYENAGVMDKTHLRFFTLKSMIRLFENAGYKVEQTAGINKNTNFKYLNLVNWFLANSLEDMKYPQYIIVAKNVKHG